MAHGHDLDRLLDAYTFEQWEAMSASIWRHSTTVLNVIAYAIGGDEAEERAQGATQAPKRPTKAPATREDLERWGTTPWRLEHAPTHTPEAEEESKRVALRQLARLQAIAREVHGGRAAQPPPAEDPEVADALASLDAFEARRRSGPSESGPEPRKGRRRRR